MESQRIPYQKTVFVCANVRQDGRVACANPGRGGVEVCESLKKKVKEAGLKGKIRVARSACLDLCEKGPNVFVYPDGAWYSGVREEDVGDIIEVLKESGR